VAVTPVASTLDTVEQFIYRVDRPFKSALLVHYLNNHAVGRVLVFTRTKHGADRLVRHLSRAGIRAEAIHGNKSQNARNRVMSSFKSSSPPILVATDIAARGLDIDEVTHVFNFDLPEVPETYVHRIGRTARAGATGTAVSFCDPEELPLRDAIERLIRKDITLLTDQPKFTAADLPKRPERHEHSTFRQHNGRRDQGRGRQRQGRGHGESRGSAQRQQSTNAEPVSQRATEAAVVAVPAAPTGVGYRLRSNRGQRNRRMTRR